MKKSTKAKQDFTPTDDEFRTIMLVLLSISSNYMFEVFPEQHKKTNRWLIPALVFGIAMAVFEIIAIFCNLGIAGTLKAFSPLTLGLVWFCAGYTTAQDKTERVVFDTIDRQFEKVTSERIKAAAKKKTVKAKKD